MQAASQNQLAAFYVGIPVKRVFSLVWGISAAIAAAAGILVAPVSLIDPLMGLVGIKAFAAAIVGGFGSLPGAIVGGPHHRHRRAVRRPCICRPGCPR